MQSEAPLYRNATILSEGALFSLGRALLSLGYALLVGAALAGPAKAQSFVTVGPSEIRLSDGGEINGARYALVELRLGGAITYWRAPGDSGVAPLFDFAGSENLGEADALYPQPRKLDEEGATVFGYRSAAAFPIRLAAVDKYQPIHLALTLNYAVCDHLCRPARAELQLDLPASPPLETPELATALAQVPQILDAAATQNFAVAALPTQDDKPRWRLSPKGASDDIFLEPPEGFYLETAKDGDGYILTLVEHPHKKTLPSTPVRVTLSGATPVEFDLLLPPPSR